MIKMSLPQNKATLGRLEPQNKAKLTLDRLEPGEAIWVPAGQIHAYVSGDCVEVKMVKMEMVKMEMGTVGMMTVIHCKHCQMHNGPRVLTL